MNVRYRSLAGEPYDAVIRSARADGTFDIDVAIPGTEHRVSLTRIRIGNAPGQIEGKSFHGEAKNVGGSVRRTGVAGDASPDVEDRPHQAVRK